MARIPYLPKTAPFTQEQRAWLNGYLAGLFADADLEGASTDTSSPPQRTTQAQPLLIMYGSQTGSAERIAKQLAAEANKREFEPRVIEMNGFSSIDLKTERRLIIVTITWGDGDPPDNAVAFWNYLNS
jgi:sulfite reductase (NADPH) flavoprotein alpha-component